MPNTRVNEPDFEMLSAYIDGALSEAERLALEARLKTEPALQAELDDLRQTVALIKSLPSLRAPRSYALTPEMVGISRPAPDLRLVKSGPSSARVIPFPMTAAFSALSAVAALVLLVVGISLLSLRAGSPAGSNIAMLPTATITLEALEQDAAPVTMMTDQVQEEETVEAQTFMFESAPSIDSSTESGSTAPQPTLEAAATLFVPAPAATVDETTARQMEQTFMEDSGGGMAGGMGGGGGDDPAGAQTGAGGAADAIPAPGMMPFSQGMPTITPTFEPLPTMTAAGTPVADAGSSVLEAVEPAAETPSESLIDDRTTQPDAIALVLIAAAVILLGVALLSTLARRRIAQDGK